MARRRAIPSPLGALPGLTCFALVLALSACVGGTMVTSTHAIGTVEGRLEEGAVAWEDIVVDCVWLVDDSGQRFDVMSLPEGWTQRPDPLRIFDPTGREVAREGAWLRITFNADAIGETMCAPGTPLVAQTVEVVESSGPGEPTVPSSTGEAADGG